MNIVTTESIEQGERDLIALVNDFADWGEIFEAAWALYVATDGAGRHGSELPLFTHLHDEDFAKADDFADMGCSCLMARVVSQLSRNVEAIASGNHNPLEMWFCSPCECFWEEGADIVEAGTLRCTVDEVTIGEWREYYADGRGLLLTVTIGRDAIPFRVDVDGPGYPDADKVRAAMIAATFEHSPRALSFEAVAEIIRQGGTYNGAGFYVGPSVIRGVTHAGARYVIATSEVAQ